MLSLNERERTALEALRDASAVSIRQPVGVRAHEILSHDVTVMYRLASLGLVAVTFTITEKGEQCLQNSSG